jgi:hypothetical protein
MKKIILSSIVIFILISFKSYSKDGDIILVRTFESISPLFSSRITISDGTTIIKSVDLEVMRPRNQEANVLKIATALKELKDQGYVLVSSNSGGNEAFTISNYIFEKR